MSNNRQQKPQGGKAPFTAQAASERVDLTEATRQPAPEAVRPQAAQEMVDALKQPTEPVTEPGNVIAENDPQVPVEKPMKKPFLAPHYDFAGANLGGQSVYNCGSCWAVVLRDQLEAHTFWHERLDSLLPGA